MKNFLKFLNINQEETFNLETTRFMLQELEQRLQNGLSVNDIENCIFFTIVLRFMFLVSCYNFKTAFIIACINLLAGYFWFKHFFIISEIYEIFLKNNFFAKYVSKFATGVPITSGNIKPFNTDNPGLGISTAFSQALIKMNYETGVSYRIDPISLIVARFTSYWTESNRNILNDKVGEIYYYFYEKFVPNMIQIFKTLWYQFSQIFAYVIITRLGKRYCPYLIRWHWTCSMLITVLEPFYVECLMRMFYFNELTLAPRVQALGLAAPVELKLQFYILNGVFTFAILCHLGLVFGGLIYALCGQYFYIKFLTPNVELHVGLRPTTSIYSQGKTPWQDQTNISDKVSESKIKKFLESLKEFIKKIFKKLKRK